MERNCRMCLQKEEDARFTVFSFKLDGGLSVYECYKLFTSISLENKLDRTKSKICLDCLQKLLAFYNDRCEAISNNDIITSWGSNDYEIEAEPECSSTEIIKMEIETDNYVMLEDPLINEPITKIEVKPEPAEENNLKIKNTFKPEPKKRGTPAKRSVVKKIEEEKQVIKPPKQKAVKKIITQPNKEKAFKTAAFVDIHGTIPKEFRNKPNNLKKVNCNVCGLAVNFSCFSRHVKRVHLKLTNFECEVCKKSFYMEYDFTMHKKVHSTKRESFNCDQCDSKYMSLQTLKSHQRTEHEGMELLPCGFPGCELKFKSVGNLNFHKRSIHQKIKLHPCNLCEKGYDYKIKLQSHQRNVHNLEIEPPAVSLNQIKVDQDDPEPESQEGDKFYKKRTKMDPKATIPCEICGKIVSRTCLRFHLSRIHKHALPKRNRYCDFCGKYYLFKYELLGHLKKHLGILDISCDHCDLKFSSRHAMVIHRRLQHYSVKTISCTYPNCETMFKTPGFLADHIRSRHLRITPYPCDECDKSFRLKSILRKHKTIKHSEVRNFKCDLCPSSFKALEGLKVHQLYHQENKHACDLCEKTYRTSHLLKAHKKVHTGIKDKHCELCTSSFYSNANLRRHMVNIHKMIFKQ